MSEVLWVLLGGASAVAIAEYGFARWLSAHLRDDGF